MAEVVRTEPAEFIQASAKVYLDELTKGIGGIKSGQLDLADFMGRKFIADPSTTITDAEALAVGDKGLGSFRPFLEQAATLQEDAAKLVGPKAYEDYMSPYQEDVIKTTLKSFEDQEARRLRNMKAQAVQTGAFGGTREGVERALFKSQSDLNRAALEAQLRQQNFGQAQNLAAQRFNQQGVLAAGQLGLAQQFPALIGQQVAGLTTIGGAQTGREQAGLTADQQLAQQRAFQDLSAAQQFGAGIQPLIAGYPGREQILPPTAAPSGLATGLGTASTLAGIYRLINPAPLKIQQAAEGGRIGFAEGESGIMKMASAPGPKDGYDDIARELFGKGYKELTPEELEIFQEELERLMNKFRTKGPVLPPDTTQPVNPFGPKPGDFGIEEDIPIKMAGYGYNEAMSDTFDMYNDMKKNGLIPPTMTFDEFLQEVVPEMSGKTPSIKLA